MPSYGAETDAAVNAGATATEIVEVLLGVIPIVGLPCVVAAAPNLAMALGYDTDERVGDADGLVIAASARADRWRWRAARRRGESKRRASGRWS